MRNLNKINEHRLSVGEGANEKLLYGLKHDYYSFEIFLIQFLIWFKFSARANSS